MIDNKSSIKYKRFQCCINSLTRVAYYTYLTNEVVCDTKWYNPKYLQRLKADVIYVTVKVDDHPIILEKDEDYYVTVYDYTCGRGKSAGDGCVTCLSHNSKYRHFDRWCSASNTCTGLWHRSMVHSVRTGRLETASPGVTELTCPEVQVRLIGPDCGAVGGETTVTFSVSNHWIMIQNQKMTVTVAGWNCAGPKTSDRDRDTITCTVTGEDEREGPVRVTYTTWQNRSYAITSEQPFGFVRPVLEDVSTGCVPLSGGYRLTITGRHLDAGSAVNVTVAEHVKCETLSRAADHIECLTGGGHEPTVGRVKVEFDRSSSDQVGAPVFVYPDGAVLDSDQSFESIATGGTTIAVRGRHFTCVQQATFAVDSERTACDVKNDTYMTCRSPPIVATRPLLSAARVLVRMPNGHELAPANTSSNRSTLALVTYPDPVFVHFEVQNGSVVILARDPIRGYAADDLAVRFPNSTGRCTDVETAADRVVCVPSPSTVVLADLVEMAVAVGDKFQRNVTRKAPTVRGEGLLRFVPGLSWTLVAVSVVSSLSIIVILGFCLGRKKLQYNVETSTDPSELQPVDQFKPADITS